ncbi:MAG: hypothetical protein ACRD2G_16555 [Terriglobia bacterium]
MTILRRSIKRELPQRVAHRQMVVELHSGFVPLREKHSPTVSDITWESIYRKAAEIQARKQRVERARAWN